MGTNKARINAYIDPVTFKALRCVAFELHRSQTSLIEEALRYYLPTQSTKVRRELKKAPPIRNWKTGGDKRRKAV